MGILTSLGSAPYLASEVNSNFAQVPDGSLSPIENHMLLVDTDSDNLSSVASPLSTINSRLISTAQEQNTTKQPHPWSPKIALPELQSPNLRSPIMVNSDTSVGSVNTLQYGSSNIGRYTKPPCPPHYSQSANTVYIKPFGSHTLDEAQQALEVLVRYFRNQQITLSEGVLLGKLMERLDLTSGQNSTASADLVA